MNRKGFTLIELLVVIAIIAILAAILFPVFGRVREQVRQTQCMTQMHQVDIALKLYYEDNKKYPAALFGFVEIYNVGKNGQDPVGDPTPATFYRGNANFPMQGTSRLHYKPLFNKQKYLNDNTILVCPDTRDKTQVVANTKMPALVTTASYPALAGVQTGTYNWTSLIWNNMGRFGTPGGAADYSNNYKNNVPVYFYKADNYDLQSKPNATLDGIDTSGAYEVHYALDWTGVADTRTELASGYANQLKYGPLCDASHTVVTWCSDHAMNAGSDKVIILTLGGSTKAVDKKTFYNAGSKQGPLNILR